MREGDAVRKKIEHRLARLEGQVRGVRKMIGEERECTDIVRQLSAVHSALESATKEILVQYLRQCLQEEEDSEVALSRMADLIAGTRL